MAYDSSKGELFVTYSESNAVSIISDSSAMPQGQTLSEFNLLVFILLATAAAFVTINLVHMKSKRKEKL